MSDRPSPTLDPAAERRLRTFHDFGIQPSKEERFRAMAEAVPGILFTTRADGSTDYVNERFYEYTGIPPGSAVSDGWQAAIHPDDLEGNLQRWQAYLGAGAPYDFKFRLRSADGDYRWFLSRSRPIRDPQGNIVQWLGTAHDIDDMVRNEEELRQSEEQFRGTFENVAVGIAHQDVNERFLRVNEKFCSIVGYTREQLLERTFRDITYPADLSAELKLYTALLRGESASYSLEKRFVHKDGSLDWAELTVSLQRNAAGTPAYTIAVLQDISERQRAEEALRVANERLDLAMRGSNIGIWENHMPDGDLGASRVELINILEPLGYDPAEIASNHVQMMELVHPAHRERVERESLAYLSCGTGEFEVEHPLRHKDGSYRWVLCRGAAVRDDAGRPVRYAGTLMDITERKQAEEVVRLANERLDLALRGSDIGIWELELPDATFPNGRIVFSNVLEQLGYGRPEMPYDFAAGINLVHPEDRPRQEEFFRSYLASETTQLDFELRLRHQDGSYRTMLVRGVAIRDAAGKPVGVIGSRIDITVRKQNEEKLQRLQRERDEILSRLQLQFQRMPVACVVTDPNFRVIDWNPAAETTFGYRKDEIVGTHCHVLVPPSVQSDLADLERRLAAGDMSAHVVNENVTKDGRVILCEWHNTPLVGADGEVFAILAMAQNVTERKRAEEALRASGERLAVKLAGMKRLQEISTRLVQVGDSTSLLLEIMDAAIAITAADMGNIQLFDRGAGALKTAASRGFESPFLEFFNTVHAGQAACGHAMKSGERVVIEDVTTSPVFLGTPALDVLLAAGVRAVQSTPLVDRSGRLVGMLSTHYRAPGLPADGDLGVLDLLARQAADWIERTQAEEALHRVHEELETRVQARTAELARANESLQAEIEQRSQAEETRSDLIRQLASAQEAERRRFSRELHDEIGRQLTFVTLGVKSLRDANPTIPPDQALLRRLQETAEKMAREVHELAVRLRPSVLDDLGLHAALLSGIEDWSRRSGVEADLHSIGFDGERFTEETETVLYRVVMEALHNVLKHADAQHVSVIVERRVDHAIAIVEDNGIGCDIETIRTRSPYGRLGLIGMRERVANLGGTLEVESTPGAGTTVFARVPLEKKE